METVPPSWQESLNLGLAYTVHQLSTFFPRILSALLIIIVGILVAKLIRKIIIKTLETFRVSRVVEKTPLELFLKNAEFGEKLEVVVGSIFFWLVLLVVAYTSVSVLGLAPLTKVFDQILSYIPHIFAAFVIFFSGVLLAGFVESVIKGSLRTTDVRTTRLFAKVASYMVVTVTTLAAVSELGIASQFLTILFTGVVFAFALGSGLAIGLGGQDTVRKIMNSWEKKDEEVVIPPMPASTPTGRSKKA